MQHRTSNAVSEPQPRLRNWQEQWDEQLELLKKYKQRFGDTRVPMSEGKTPRGYDCLRMWLAMARTAVNLYHKNPKASTFLTKAKVDALMDVEFSDTSYPEAEWDERFEEWSRYKKAQGTPEAFAKPQSVYDWELRTREQYNSKVLTARRMQKLTEQGFKFSTTKPEVVPFEDRVEEWKEYRKTHATDPSIYFGRPTDTSLGAWVVKMRRKYRQLKKGKGSKQEQVQEQVDRLTQLGFTWNTDLPLQHRLPFRANDPSRMHR
jgi:hypothetical protein